METIENKAVRVGKDAVIFSAVVIVVLYALSLAKIEAIAGLNIILAAVIIGVVIAFGKNKMLRFAG